MPPLKIARKQFHPRKQIPETEGLRARLEEAEEKLSALHAGDFNQNHAGHDFIESMNEGALTLEANGTILYANPCFIHMVASTPQAVIGTSFQNFFSKRDKAGLRLLLNRQYEFRWKPGAEIQMTLHASNGFYLPALISIHLLTKKNAADTAHYGVLITDMTEVLQREEQLRALSNRLVDVHEAERKRVAGELHESISQLTYGILIRCDILARTLPATDGASRGELLKLRDLLSKTTEEVRSMAVNLRPTALDDLGLNPVLRAACVQFGARAHVQVNLDGVQLNERLAPEIETELFRISQKALQNVEKYARARSLTVMLNQHVGFVQLIIKDDGVGFNPYHPPTVTHENHGFGLLRMRERASYVGGTLRVKSAPGAGTEIRVRVPIIPPAAAATAT